MVSPQPEAVSTASLDDYAATVAAAGGGRPDLVIVGQSYVAFTATLAAAQLRPRLLVLLAGMIPAPGESPGQWWANTGYRHAVQQQARLDGGKTGHDDSAHQLLQRFAAPAGRGGAAQGWARGVRSGLEHTLASRYVAGRAHQVRRVPGPPVLPAAFMRQLAQQRLGTIPDEIPGCHCAALSHPPGTQRSSRQLPRLTGSGRSGSRRSGHLPQQPKHFRVEPLGNLRRGRIVVRRQLTGDAVVSDPGAATRHLLDEDGDRRV
jgi:hypothetical protein